ncbi:terminase small subunit [Reyranella soli]|uniref:Terminase n=1 Tax=Reyranella soli TaxID=1230389 RepID=A0A512NNM9_9HYPH|nr:terminase small subunit [Reyranella soli]GEP60550.1 hypothetical protein RSO01_77160 [Reyranella soli]
MAKTNVALDPRERRFVELYCETGKKAQAALVAGYGGNLNSASVQADRLCKRKRVIDAIDERMAQLIALYDMGPDRIKREVAAVASVPLSQIELKGSDKIKALELMAKLSRMMPGDKVEVSGPGGGPIEVNANHRMDIAALGDDERAALKQVLLALKAKQIEHEPPRS